MMMDVTEQKLAQGRLAESEARLESIIDHAPVMIFVRDLDDRYVLVNRKYEETMGLVEKEIIGKTPRDVLDKELAEKLMENDRKVIQTGVLQEVEEALPEKYGSRVIFSLKFPLRTIEGKTYALCGILTDITERKKSEEKARDYVRRLQGSNQMLQDFAFIASHDLQEPLRKIHSFGDRLKTRYTDDLDETGKDYIERMLGAADRMSKLLKSLLTYSRVTTKTEPFVHVDLARVMREVVLDLEIPISETGAKVEVGDLPTIQADPSQMRQLFQNLVGNALKYHKDGESPHVRVYSNPCWNGSCEILVEDNGIGFDERYAEKIFAPFQRLHGRSSSYEGSGMGLAICRKITERHNGIIRARSSPREGSTFIVSLPLRQCEEKELWERDSCHSQH